MTTGRGIFTAAGEACMYGGWQCIAATWGESYLEILGVFTLSFVFFLCWLRPALDDKQKKEVTVQQRRLVRRPPWPASAVNAAPFSNPTQNNINPRPPRSRPTSPPRQSSSPTRQSSSNSTRRASSTSPSTMLRALSDSRAVPGSSGTRFYSNVVARAQREHQGL